MKIKSYDELLAENIQYKKCIEDIVSVINIDNDGDYFICKEANQFLINLLNSI